MPIQLFAEIWLSAAAVDDDGSIDECENDRRKSRMKDYRHRDCREENPKHHSKTSGYAEKHRKKETSTLRKLRRPTEAQKLA